MIEPVIITVAILLVATSIAVFADISTEEYLWNDGCCKKCNGIWYKQGTWAFKIRKYRCQNNHIIDIMWLNERPVDPEGTLK